MLASTFQQARNYFTPFNWIFSHTCTYFHIIRVFYIHFIILHTYIVCYILYILLITLYVILYKYCNILYTCYMIWYHVHIIYYAFIVLYIIHTIHLILCKYNFWFWITFTAINYLLFAICHFLFVICHFLFWYSLQQDLDLCDCSNTLVVCDSSGTVGMHNPIVPKYIKKADRELTHHVSRLILLLALLSTQLFPFLSCYLLAHWSNIRKWNLFMNAS